MDLDDLPYTQIIRAEDMKTMKMTIRYTPTPFKAPWSNILPTELGLKINLIIVLQTTNSITIKNAFLNIYNAPLYHFTFLVFRYLLPYTC